MPVNPERMIRLGGSYTEPVDTPETAFFPNAQTSEGSILGAAFRQHNTLGSLVEQSKLREYEDAGAFLLDAHPDDFDPFEHIKGTVFEAFPEALRDVTTPQEFHRQKVKVEREIRMREIMQNAGWKGILAGLAAGVFDPVNIIPIGRADMARRAVARGARTKSFVYGGLVTARAGLLSESAAQVALDSMQETRTFGEMALDVTAATILSGFLGGSINGLSAGAQRRALRNLGRDVHNTNELADSIRLADGDMTKADKWIAEQETKAKESTPNREEVTDSEAPKEAEKKTSEQIARELEIERLKAENAKLLAKKAEEDALAAKRAKDEEAAKSLPPMPGREADPETPPATVTGNRLGMTRENVEPGKPITPEEVGTNQVLDVLTSQLDVRPFQVAARLKISEEAAQELLEEFVVMGKLVRAADESTGRAYKVPEIGGRPAHDPDVIAFNKARVAAKKAKNKKPTEVTLKDRETTRNLDEAAAKKAEADRAAKLAENEARIRKIEEKLGKQERPEVAVTEDNLVDAVISAWREGGDTDVKSVAGWSGISEVKVRKLLKAAVEEGRIGVARKGRKHFYKPVEDELVDVFATPAPKTDAEKVIESFVGLHGDHGPISAAAVAEQAGLEAAKVKRLLDKFVRDGIAVRIGKGKEARYVPTRRPPNAFDKPLKVKSTKKTLRVMSSSEKASWEDAGRPDPGQAVEHPMNVLMRGEDDQVLLWSADEVARMLDAVENRIDIMEAGGLEAKDLNMTPSAFAGLKKRLGKLLEDLEAHRNRIHDVKPAEPKARAKAEAEGAKKSDAADRKRRNAYTIADVAVRNEQAQLMKENFQGLVMEEAQIRARENVGQYMDIMRTDMGDDMPSINEVLDEIGGSDLHRHPSPKQMAARFAIDNELAELEDEGFAGDIMAEAKRRAKSNVDQHIDDLANDEEFGAEIIPNRKQVMAAIDADDGSPLYHEGDGAAPPDSAGAMRNPAFADSGFESVMIRQQQLRAYVTAQGIVNPTGIRLARTFFGDGHGIAELLSKTPLIRRLVGPGVERLANSFSESAKRAFLMLGDSVVRVEGADDLGTSIESIVKAFDAHKDMVLTFNDQMFIKYRMRLKGETVPKGTVKRARLKIALGKIADRITEDTGAMSREAFNIEVSRAMSAGDTSAIPEVLESVNMIRNMIFNPILAKMKAVGLAGEELGAYTVKGARGYLPRKYLVDKLEVPELRDRFRAVLISKLRNELSADEISAMVAKHPDIPRDFAIDIEIGKDVDSIIETLMGIPQNRLHYEPIAILRRGSALKGRKLDFVEDHEIEFVLDRNIENLVEGYVRSVVPDVALVDMVNKNKHLFGPNGKDEILSTDPVEFLHYFRTEHVGKEYRRLMNLASSQRELERLKQELFNDENSLSALVGILRGTYTTPKDGPISGPLTTIGRVARSSMFTLFGGGFMISSVPDLGNIVLKHGFMRTFAHGIKPLVSHMNEVKIVQREARLAAASTELTLNTRSNLWADLEDEIARNKIETGSAWVARKFSMVNGMAAWNHGLKMFTSNIVQTRLVEAIDAAAAGKATARQIADLRHVRITEDMVKKISKELNAPGGRFDGVSGLRAAQTSRWADSEAVLAYRAAVRQGVDNVIITPGLLDRPTFMSKELGKTIFQFQSFAMAATNRILITTAQDGMSYGKAAALGGIAQLIAWGMLTEFFKFHTASESARKELPDSMHRWVLAGIDRSGAGGFMTDVANKVMRLYGTDALSSRYAARNTISSLLGPSFGLTESVFKVGRSTVRNEWTQGDVRQIRRLTPGNNLWYMSRIFDEFEQGVNNQLNMPRTRDGSRASRRGGML